MDGEDHTWELSKENVQPLRQGRHMSSLTAALHPDHSEEHIKAQQKNNFELELRTYSGDDPFSVWESYIKWTEQYFPKGGQDGQLMKLLERCLKEYQADKRYTNDERFIHMWIKFAYFSDDPVIVFSYMFDNGIGVNVASLFVEWALSLERQGDIKRADAIYVEGLNRNAAPKDLLLQRHQQFQSRVARNITLQIAENQNPGMDMGEDTEKRSALGRLKASGATHKVGTVRTGNVKLGSAGSLKDNRPVIPKQLSNRAIPIYHDAENVLPSLAPQQSNEWQTLPVPEVDNRENNKKPGVWTDAKVKQKPGSAPSVAPSIPFQIHEDPDSATHETPRKTTLVNTQPLSSRKTSQTDILSNLRRPPEGTSFIMEIPMYQKDKIYNGLSEFSFEELRVAKYSKLKKEKQAEADKLQKEAEQKLSEEQMKRQLLDVTERLSMLQAQINGINFNRTAGNQPQQQNLIVQQLGLASQLQGSLVPMSENAQSTSEVQSETQQHVTAQGVSQSLKSDSTDVSSSSFASSSFITPTSTNVSLNTNQGKPCDPLGANINRSLRTPIFNTVSTYTTGSLPSFKRFQPRPPLQTSSTGSNNSFESSLVSSEGNNSIAPVSVANSSAVTSNTSTGMLPSVNTCLTTPFGKGSQHDSTSKHSKLVRPATPRSAAPTPENHTGFITKGPLAAPSPTVYTKEALQCVMGMFSTSLSYDDHTMSEEVQPNTGKGASNSSTQIPFEIHEDTTGTIKTERQSFKVASVKKGFQHFYMESDDAKENVLKATVQRPPANASSQRLEIYCDEPQDKENEVKATSGKRSARRGLGFAVYDDVEMLDMDKEIQPMNADFTIECQARYDTTLAPLDSFLVHAKAASTPCVRAVDKPRLLLAQSLGDTGSSCLTSSESTTNMDGESSAHTQHLSPIPEGSGDGSREDTKSSQHATSKMSHSANTQPQQNGVRDSAHDIMEAETEIDRDVSMREDVGQGLDRSCYHQIDTTAYISPDSDEKTEALLSTSICLDPKDPFDDNTIAYLLGNLSPPITEYPNFTSCSGQLDDICIGSFMCFGKLYVSVDKCIGEGGYAKIYKITDHSIGGDDTINMDTLQIAISKVVKVQSPPCYWEFYVSCELRRRLAILRAPMDVVSSIMDVDQGYFFKNGSVLQMTYFPKGSLLNLVNTYKSDRCLLNGVEPFACLLTIELLHIFEQIHKCGFIHSDVKPDNFLLQGLPRIKEGCRNPQEVFGSQLHLVQLIDFGQSIDLTKFAKGTTFMAKVVTSGFQCIEMRTDRPWTFQTDLFGLVGTIHVVLFGTYMNVFQEKGTWRVTANYVRKWNVPLWKHLFNELLNIPSCDQQPDLPSIRREFEKHFMDNLIPAYNSWVQEVTNLETVSQ